MINWKRVSALQEEIGELEFAEVVEIFLEEVEALIGRLRANPKPELFEEDLHFLKGCAVNLGFEDLATRCLAGETIASRGNPEEVDLGVIFGCYDASKAVFLEGVKSGLAA